MENKQNKKNFLALGRTHMANERTMLSYWRTALTFLVLGAYLIRQTPAEEFILPATIAILFGVVLFIFGTVKFYQFKKIINNS
ncbi:MAG TPA: DUF202 domain-containing protein [Candidatus Methanoperedens sp.]|nr:DUF202 domain-containing protein [Candidatus Methanoperedens sp.]